ncbi:hypothetical protein Kpho02_63020 [Kitasatospora phosalacinea]|uniref:Uncharacterized protein n=1 Tax=Kitasatospora phosalacinea TaxID=2065 RepID=A0A9W6QFB2_9ACTN|nr:hypothetical protein [Kitasatospora phosalacinea]GLW74004.1 hypothetical protein Kpho02_63020 [Kitasatospora phosalacinea]
MTDRQPEEPPEAGRRRGRPDWGAVAALSGVAAALVALLAYLLPPDPPRPGPAPAPVVDSSAEPAPERTTPSPRRSPAPTPTPTPSDSPSPEPEPEPDAEPDPSPTAEAPVHLPPVPPAGCREAAAAVAAYRRDAGSTRGSQADAANLAYQGLMRAGTDADPPVRPTIVRLAQEFQELGFRLNGMVMADPNEVVTDINADLATLDRQCGSGS